MYTFLKTEKNNNKASEFETKSLLYLIGIHNDSDQIDVITIDCFNDVTGANEQFIKLWDVQSKNHKTLPPSKIGESLITLYENYLSSLNFVDFILFIPKLNRDYLVDSSLNVYGYDNINPEQKIGIEEKLIEKINGAKNTERPTLLTDFLGQITFVEDNKEISTYIKRISKFKRNSVVSNELYESIFKDIRDTQASLKNSYIENETIKQPVEVLKFNRHITKNEIHTLIISRLVGIDVFSFPGVPFPFLPRTRNLDSDEAKDLVLDCNANLSRAFFDKNGCKNFWKISEFLIVHLKNNPQTDANTVFIALTSSVNITTNYLTHDTILYMISLIMTGLTNDN